MVISPDFTWVAAGRLIIAVVGIATIRLSTAMLPPEQYGLMAILLTFQAFCGLFLINPVGQYVNRHTHRWLDEGTLLSRLRKYRLWIYFAAIAAAIVSGIWSFSQPFSWDKRAFIIAVVTLMVFAATVNATSISLLNMIGHRSLSVGWACTTAFSGLFFSWILTHIFENGLAWFTGQAIGMTIGAVGAVRSVYMLVPFSRKTSYPLLDFGALRNYILPLAVATGFMWWLVSGYRLMLEAHWGLSALGTAVVGLSLTAQIWGVLESLTMQYLYPMFYRRISADGTQDKKDAFSDLLNTLGPVYLIFAAATLVGAQPLLKLFIDARYTNVVPFILMGVLIECCRALSNVFGTAAQVEQRMVPFIIPYSAGALVLTIGLLIVSAENNISYSISILIIAGLTTLIMMILIMTRLQQFKIDWKRWASASGLTLFAALLNEYEPLVADGFASALGWLIIIGMLATTAIAALTWNNQAVARLISVSLKHRNEKDDS